MKCAFVAHAERPPLLSFPQKGDESEEFKKLEEALPRLKGCDLENASDYIKQKQEVGGRRPGLDKRNKNVVELMEKVEQSGKWPQQACTTMFLLILTNVTSERPIALMPTLIRWWEAMRAAKVAKWQQRY